MFFHCVLLVFLCLFFPTVTVLFSLIHADSVKEGGVDLSNLLSWHTSVKVL